jgi:hypothetical protein
VFHVDKRVMKSVAMVLTVDASVDAVSNDVLRIAACSVVVWLMKLGVLLW